MMSGSLYWAKWKENIKRRGGTLILCFVSLFLALPVCNLVELNARQNSVKRYGEYGADAEELNYLTDYMKSVFTQNVEYSEVFVLCAAAFAVLLAVQGFSFLYSRQKMDLYMSVPVSAPKRFVMIWANGIFMFGGCYLVNLLLCWGIGAAFGIVNAELLAGSLLAFFVNMLAFTAMYQLALVAVMLTGNALTALLGCFVLYCYEWVVRFLIVSLKESFFTSFIADRIDTLPWLTPFIGYLDFSGRIWYQQTEVGGYYRAADYFGTSAQSGWCSALAREAGMLFLAAVIGGLLCYWLFRKRKTEGYHHAIAFPGWKPVLEFLVLVPVSLLTALFVSSMAKDQNAFLFAGGFLGWLIGHAVIQLVYEKELKAVVKKRNAALCALVFAAAVLCVFRFDLAGFDGYLPERGKVQSVSVTLQGDYSNFGYNFLESENGDRTLSSVLLTGMNSENDATIEAVLDLAAAWQAAGRPTRTASGSSAGAVSGSAREAEEAWKIENIREFMVRYNLTDGRSVLRLVYVDTAQSQEALDIVMRDEAYRRLRYQINAEEFERAVDRMKIVYTNGSQEFLYTLDKQTLLQALRRDFEDYSYRLIDSSLPCGMLQFSLKREGNSADYIWSYPVYDSFADTIGVLAENEIPAGDAQAGLLPEDIREITVRYYIYNDAYDAELGMFEPGEVEDQELVCSFEEPEEIRQILEGVYFEQLFSVAGTEVKNMERADRLRISVSLTSEALRKHYTADDLFFLKDGVPDFVKKKLKEAAVRG